MRRRWIGGLAAVAALMSAPAAGAVPLLFGGHYYDYVSADAISWAAARDAAAAGSYLGQSGYLATITSAAENEFLRSNFSIGGGFAGSWLGGVVAANGAQTWETGPEAGQAFTYSNWGGIEPNNAPSAAYMNIGGATFGIGNGQWADAGGYVARDSDPVRGYFVEFSGGVPEPAAWAMMVLGFGGLGALLRRRRAAVA